MSKPHINNPHSERYDRAPRRQSPKEAIKPIIATVLAGLAIYGLSAKGGDALDSLRGDKTTPNTEQLRAPAPGEPSRVLVFGNTYVDNEGDEHVLLGVESAAGLIHELNPKVSEQEAKQFIEDENEAFQREQGVEKPDPLKVLKGQGVRFSDDIHVGTLIIKE